MSSPYGLAVDASGNLFIADLGNHRVRRVARDGTITTVASAAPDGSALVTPRNVALDPVGNLYIADFDANRVYRVTPAGTVTLVAGTGSSGYTGDGGLAVQAQLDHPAGLATDRMGGLYIGDTQNHVVRKVVGGVIRTLTAAPAPTDLATDTLGTLYVPDAWGGAVLRIPASGDAPSDQHGGAYGDAGQDKRTARERWAGRPPHHGNAERRDRGPRQSVARRWGACHRGTAE
ncbi:MAG: hypothetical protein WDO18_09095 [Acidobacteriota bacterium]